MTWGLVILLPSLPNIFVPKVGVGADELAHQLNAVRIVEDGDVDTVLAEEVFRAEKVLILADDDAGNAVEQGRAGAHDAGAERADESEVGPVAAASGVAKTDGLGVRSGVSGLDAEVVSARDDVAVTVG